MWCSLSTRLCLFSTDHSLCATLHSPLCVPTIDISYSAPFHSLDTRLRRATPPAALLLDHCAIQHSDSTSSSHHRPSMSSEPISISDSGFHLPGHTSSADACAAPLATGVGLLSSLLSLPPRANKRRRGNRFRAEEEEQEEGEEAKGEDRTTVPPAQAAQRAEQRPLKEKKFECQSRANTGRISDAAD